MDRGRNAYSNSVTFAVQEAPSAYEESSSGGTAISAHVLVSNTASDHDILSCPGYINEHAGTQGLLTKTKAGGQGARFASKRKLVEGKDRHSAIAVSAGILNL